MKDYTKAEFYKVCQSFRDSTDFKHLKDYTKSEFNKVCQTFRVSRNFKQLFSVAIHYIPYLAAIVDCTQ